MMIEQFTILDQIEIVRSRVIQLRFGVVTLENGEESGCAWHRGMIRPGDDPVEMLATIAADIEAWGYPQPSRGFEMLPTHLVGVVHAPDVIDAWRDARARQPVGDNNFQHVSIVDQIVITRSRECRVRFGLVTLKGEREVFNRFNDGHIKPVDDPVAFITTVRKGLRDRGDPPLTSKSEALISAIAGAVHTPDIVSAWESGAVRWVQRLAAQRREIAGRRPILSPEDALLVARV